MRDISNAELATLVAELKDELSNLYIDKFYEDNEGKFRLKLTKRGVQINLQCILSKTINKTVFIERSETPTNFALAVRKRIEGFIIEGIEQYNHDRIIIIKLRKKEEKENLIIEMFGKGNFIITDSEMRILMPYYIHEFKDRAIKKDVEYAAPPKNALAKPPEPPESHLSVIYRDENDKAIDYSIGSNPKYSSMKQQHFPTLGEALDEFYHETYAYEKKQKNPKEEELMASLKKQESIVAGIEADIEEMQKKGSFLMSQMHVINQIIKTLQSNKRMTLEELQKHFPKTKVLSIDLKEKSIEIEANLVD